MAPTTQNTPLTNNPKKNTWKISYVTSFFVTCQGTQRIAGRIYDPWSISAVATRLGPLAQRLGNGPKMMGRKVKVTKGLKIWAIFGGWFFFLMPFFLMPMFFFDAYPIFKVSMLDFCIVYIFISYCWWQPEIRPKTNQLICGNNIPIIYRVSYMSGGCLGFIPSNSMEYCRILFVQKKKQNGSPTRSGFFRMETEKSLYKQEPKSKQAPKTQNPRENKN